MEVSPDIIARAIDGRPTRLAVFDVDLRERTGQWYLADRIPIDDILDDFSQHEAFDEDGGTVQIPLHEPESAELTDEYLRADLDANTVQFYDPGATRVRTIPLSELARTVPAWRIRFWTSAYPIEEPTSFMYEFGDVVDDTAVPSSAPESTAGMVSEAFFEAVRSTLVATRERRREDMRRTFKNISTNEFLEEYGGIADVRAAGRSVDEYGQQIVELALPADHPLAEASESDLRELSRLQPGDEVVVDGDHAADLPVEAELFAIGTEGLELGVYWDSARGTRAEDAFEPGNAAPFTIGKLIDGRRYRTIAEAIDTVDRTDHARQRYAGTADLTVTEEAMESTRELNRDQMAAVRRGVGATEVLCIHAPPWTGVRRTIWELARGATAEDDQVLILAPNSRTLDRLIDGEDWSMHNAAERAGIDLVVHREQADRQSAPDILVLPMDAAGSIDDHSIDLAIVDQAARIDVPTGAIPFAKAGRVVLVGDPWQGGPPTTSASRGSDLPRSIFDHLYTPNADNAVALRTQYRMHQAIAQFPNQQFYDGTLIHGGRNRTWTIDTLDPLAAIHVDTDVRTTPTGSVHHDGEIAVAVDEVKSLLERGINPDDIGILTPFSAQIGKLRVALNDIEPELGDAVLVGGLDMFRCESRDVIIVSFVGSGYATGDGRVEGTAFMTAEGLNTVLTRAAKRIVLIADWTAITNHGGEHAGLVTFLTERGLLDTELG